MEATLVQSMGSDLTVVNAARVSFNKESEWDGFSNSHNLKQADAKLIRYLARHQHWTPFSHAVVTLREKVPIFVARQRFKHTVGFSYNEVSRRYVDDDPEFFVPDTWRSRPEGGIKQGSGEAEVVYLCGDGNIQVAPLPNGFSGSGKVKECYNRLLKYSQDLYSCMIDSGVAPEQARMVLPQSMYTEYYVTGSLAAWARAYNLRKDAQKEIQDLADIWDEIISPLFPCSWDALTGETNE